MTIYFGENLKKFRKAKELTQETLADFLGVSFQAVSKWERNESYPDITMLPSIASFFGVTVDDLLGVDKAKREQNIDKYIKDFDALYFSDTPKAYEMISKAVREFPGEFSLLIRYMKALISTKGGIKDNPKNIFEEMTSINETIQGYCTSDNIRINAKRLMGTYYKTLSYTEKDDSYIAKMEEINRDLPVMRDSRDYTATHMYPPGEKHDKACRDAIEELVFLLDGALVNYCFYNDDFSNEFKIKAAEKIVRIMDIIYDDGIYGENWHNMAYNYGHLGHWHYENSDTEKSLEYFEKCAKIAKKYDDMPNTSEMKSLLLDGKVFTKTTHGKTLCERMKHHMTVNYPLSDEFKSTKEFKKIVKILE